jgi:hydroxymethylglutaryl-CoA lyase
MSNFIEIYEVGPRDGLQNEDALIPARDKIKLVDLLSDVGFRHIEVTSFVSPKWVPQMADASEVMAGITRRDNIAYAVLTPNMKGFEAAHAAGANEVAIFGAASEGFSQKNINCSIAESLERFRPVMTAAKEAGLPVRGYVSCVVACPYDGATPPETVRDVAETLLEMGCYEISLGDTIGAGMPDDIKKLLAALTETIPSEKLAGHFHDTSGRALNNVDVALDFGIRRFDAAAGGLGGCPYAPGAKGNLATMSLAKHLLQKDFETGLDLEKLAAAETFLKTLKFSPKGETKI